MTIIPTKGYKSHIEKRGLLAIVVNDRSGSLPEGKNGMQNALSAHRMAS
jgi:hypothetical protein